MSAIVAGSDDAIISKDLNGTIMSWNQAAERIFGYAASEVLGRPITILIPAERQHEEITILNRLRAGERIDHFETVRITKDGRLVDVALTISPIRDAAGSIVGASKIARDITASKLAQKALQDAHHQLTVYSEQLEAQVLARTAQLRESLEELETFSSSIPHDIKAPLRAISAFVQILREDHAAELTPEAQALLAKIAHSCSRLDRFIENVLSYARLRHGTVQLHRVDLATVVPKVIEEYPHARQANAEVFICQPLLPVQASEGLLIQSVANLISNAAKFVTPGTRPIIRIWTEPRGAIVRLWVQDNGIGIADQDRERIFGLFQRLHTQAHYDGTGVGLAVVQRAIARMGGSTGVESQFGQGSRFWIDLKAAPPSAPSNVS